MIKVFYYDSELNEGVESSEAINLDHEQSINLFYSLSEAEGSFIGFKDEKNILIQFDWHEENLWIADVPMVDKRGSYQKCCEYDVCVQIIGLIYNGDIAIVVKEFVFVEW